MLFICADLINMKLLRIKELIRDLPKGGPLAVYRKRANFDWKTLKFFLFGEDYLEYQVISHQINVCLFSSLHKINIFN